MKNELNKMKKKRLSKRGKLFLANGLALLAFVIGVFYNWIVLDRVPVLTVPSYIILMCAFAFFSLIVYYLSIIADALDRRNKKDDKSGETSPADAGHTK